MAPTFHREPTRATVRMWLTMAHASPVLGMSIVKTVASMTAFRDAQRISEHLSRSVSDWQ